MSPGPEAVSGAPSSTESNVEIEPKHELPAMATESNEDSGQEDKVNEDLVKFMRKRSETQPRYVASLKNYIGIHDKRRRARQRKENKEKAPANVQNESPPESGAQRSVSQSRLAHTQEPEDACGMRRRRRRRRRSCGRRRRRRSRRSRCGRRRRSRSRSRRRRRRSLARRRRRRRCGCR